MINDWAETVFENTMQFVGKIIAFEIMVDVGFMAAESLQELPLIAKTIARKRRYDITIVISYTVDTVEYE
jgi:hypothetical protein